MPLILKFGGATQTRGKRGQSGQGCYCSNSNADSPIGPCTLQGTTAETEQVSPAVSDRRQPKYFCCCHPTKLREALVRWYQSIHRLLPPPSTPFSSYVVTVPKTTPQIRISSFDGLPYRVQGIYSDNSRTYLTFARWIQAP
jgi:hypothetical protein